MKNQALSLNRPEIAQTALVFLATLAALALLVWVLAHWTWQWFAPRPATPAQAVATAPGRMEAANHLFGRPPEGPSANAVTVLGVIAATGGGSGYAILRFAAQPPRPVREGEEIAAGLRLAEVHADRIVVERGGLAETIALPLKKTPANAGNTAANRTHPD